MEKRLIFVVYITLFLIIISGFIAFNNQDKNPQVCFEENCFFVEIAETQAEKAKGLMFRESLKEDKGMLFVYNEEGNYSFWMKNTSITLDIIWINSEKEVVYIKREAQPCNEECEILTSSENAQFVLEIKGGTTEKSNISIGNKIEFYNI